MAEGLLPGTRAIPSGTLEYSKYRGGWLLRLKTDYTALHRRFPDTPAGRARLWRDFLELEYRLLEFHDTARRIDGGE